MGAILYLLFFVMFFVFVAWLDKKLRSSSTSKTTDPAILKPETNKHNVENKYECKTIQSVTTKIESSSIKITDEFKKVEKLLESESQVIFISGGAGTGKTTLIKWLINTEKADIALAFTGVAAQNCEGQTIHSFFELPFGVQLPKIPVKKLEYDSKPDIISNMRVLIIDEISMVRADILDAVDRCLKCHRSNNAPFGGVKVLLIGDLYQLPPITKNCEFIFDSKLDGHLYDSKYFFDSYVIKSIPKLKYLELTKHFRHNEDEIDYLQNLNYLRKCSNLFEACKYFNDQCFSNDKIPLDNYVNLTTTNNAKDKIDYAMLHKLPGEEKVFTGIAKGSFVYKLAKDDKRESPKLPAPKNLKLKENAFVMLLRNDPKKSYVNGSTGIVKAFYHNAIEVELSDTGQHIFVNLEQWEDIKYKWDEEKRKIVKDVIGAYTQYPLCLSWACTIHKAQGKTIPLARVDFGSHTFDSGQAYVAMSRTRSINHLVLKRKINPSDIKPNPIVDNFYAKF